MKMKLVWCGGNNCAGAVTILKTSASRTTPATVNTKNATCSQDDKVATYDKLHDVQTDIGVRGGNTSEGNS